MREVRDYPISESNLRRFDSRKMCKGYSEIASKYPKFCKFRIWDYDILHNMIEPESLFLPMKKKRLGFWESEQVF